MAEAGPSGTFTALTLWYEYSFLVGFSSAYNTPRTEPSLRQTASSSKASNSDNTSPCYISKLSCLTQKTNDFNLNSPTGSTMSSTPFRMPLRTNLDTLRGTPLKRTVIRSDRTMKTCFSPEDQELYKLWAPKWNVYNFRFSGSICILVQ